MASKVRYSTLKLMSTVALNSVTLKSWSSYEPILARTASKLADPECLNGSFKRRID